MRRQVGRSRRDSIAIHLTEVGWEGVNGISLAQDTVQWRAFVDMVMNRRILIEASYFLRR